MPKLIRLLPWLAAATISVAPAFADIYINIAGTLQNPGGPPGTQPFTATLEVDSNYAFTAGSGKVTDFTFDIYQGPPSYGYQDAFLQHITPTSATFCKPEDYLCVINATVGLSNGQLSVTIASSACCDTLGYVGLSDDTHFGLREPYPPDGQTYLFVTNLLLPNPPGYASYAQDYSSGAGLLFVVNGALTVSSTPEPSLYLLLGAGLVGLGWKRRRR